MSDAAAEEPLELHFDVEHGRLCGWSALRRPEQNDNAVTLSLMIGSLRLGTIQRDRVRPDVEAHLGFPGPPPGFSVQNYGLEAFARMSSLDLTIVIGGEGTSWKRHPLPAWQMSSSEPEPLASRHRLSAPFRLADLWFTSSRDLCLRFDGDATLEWTLDVYQPSADGDPVAVLIAADRKVGATLTVVTARLANPLLPLLLVFRNEAGSISAIDFIPFPSLARGGAHAVERAMLGQGGDGLADIATLSLELLRAFMARKVNGADTVRAIELDPSTCTGLEPVLNEDVLAWLCGPMDIAVRPTDAAAVPTFVAEKLARPEIGRPGHVLMLPADAIPTISALVRPLRVGLGGIVLTGAIGVLDWGNQGAAWSVWTPPCVGDWLDGLQWRDGYRTMPMVRLRESPGSGDKVPTVGWPLALALCQKPSTIGRDTPFEVATEMPLPLLRNGVMSADADVSVVILFDRPAVLPLPLLESLARQQYPGTLRLIVCRPTGEEDPRLLEAMDALFTDRFMLLPVSPSSGRLDQIAAARAYLVDEQVLLLTAQTLLPDPRTLAALLPMLAEPTVATVGCLVRDTARTAGQAGYGPAGIDLRGTPSLAFETIDPAAFRQPATFPVSAGAMTALATRRSLLAEVSRDGSDPDRPDSDDLLLGLHMLARGGINLCTTIVSVFTERLPPTGRYLALTVPYRLAGLTVGRLIDTATVVQKLR